MGSPATCTVLLRKLRAFVFRSSSGSEQFRLLRSARCALLPAGFANHEWGGITHTRASRAGARGLGLIRNVLRGAAWSEAPRAGLRQHGPGGELAARDCHCAAI